jgi:hypothetical protein
MCGIVGIVGFGPVNQQIYDAPRAGRGGHHDGA